MSSACYCDYGDDRPTLYRAERRKARKQYRCYECHGHILPGEQYERVSTMYDGSFDVTRTCRLCLDARDYIEAHAPCFCWLHGSMLDDAKYVLNENAKHSAGFWIGGMKRVLRAERSHTRRTTKP